MAIADGKVEASTWQALDAAVAAGKVSGGGATNIKKWLTESGYRTYVPRITEMISAGRFEELDTLFWEVIPFGTGGRRGMMSDFGSATINDRTIAESANGLAVYLKKAKGSAQGKAVIAYDTRLRSREFAQLTATTLAAHGLDVWLFDGHRSTPELSFAVRYLGCDVGAMISASHNPPADNGFKAYWSAGAQVLPPHDKGIIDAVYQSNEIPKVDFDPALADGRIRMVSTEVDGPYIQAVAALSLSAERDLPALYTPLHGVGETSVFAVLRHVGFRGIEIFEPQRQADGNFPNVPKHLPNPELKSVFEPAIQVAKKGRTALILASDPDADRLGVCVRQGDEFVHLTGNRIAAVLVDYVLRKRSAARNLTPEHYVVETLVTTPLVAAIARAHGVRAIDDLLVGFKYIAEVMDREGPELFVFGAEESLGYLAGTYARDKDAAAAALYLSECAAELRQEGKTVLDRLDELYTQHGYFLESQKSETCQGPRGRQMIEQIMEEFAVRPPAALAGIEFKQVLDYRRHEVRKLPENTKLDDLPRPSGDMLIFDAKSAECEIRCAVRPSGTEPKIKFYFFARAAVPPGGRLDELKARTEARLGQFQEALSAWAQGVWSRG